MRERRILALVLVMTIFFSGINIAFAGNEGTVYGWDKSKSEWQNSNIVGWKEGESVSSKLIPESDASSSLTIDLDYINKKGYIGFDDADGWFIGLTTESSIESVLPLFDDSDFTVTGPNLVDNSLRYNISLDSSIIEQLAGRDWSLYWFSHPSVTGSNNLFDGEEVDKGSSFWSGSSMHISYVEANQEVSFNIEPKADELIFDLSIDKTVNGESSVIIDSGDEVEYMITISNIGNQILDVNFTDSDGYLLNEAYSFSLDAGSDVVITYQAIYDEIGTVTNTAIAEYVGAEGRTFSETANAVVYVMPYYGLEIIKTATPSAAYIGEDITYTITVTNTSSEDLTNISVEDKDLDFTTVAAIDAGASKSFTLHKTYELEGQYINVAGAEAPDFVSLVTAQAIVDIGEIPIGSLIVYKDFAEGTPTTTMPFNFRVYSDPSLTDSSIVAQTSTRYGDPEIIEDLEAGTYYVGEQDLPDYIEPAAQMIEIVSGQRTQVTLTNTAIEGGTVIIHKNVPNVTDDPTLFDFELWYIPESPPIILDNFVAALPPQLVTSSAISEGGILVFEGLEDGSYFIEEEYIWEYMQDDPVRYFDISSTTPSAEFTFVNTLKTYEMELTKTVNDSSVYVNDPVTYTVTVENTGNQDLYNVVLTDNDSYALNTTEAIESISAGAVKTFTYNTSYGSTGTKTNIAGLTFRQFVEGPLKTITAQAIVNVSNRTITRTDYSMSINKVADLTQVNVGDLITYTITVRNTGDGTLTDVSVVDNLTGLNEVISRLDIGTSQVFTSTFVAQTPGLLTNTVTATDDRAGTETDDEVVEVLGGTPLGLPGLTITKTVVGEAGQIFNPGDTVEFKILVTNVGSENLTNILVSDILAGFSEVIPILVPNQSKEFTVAVVLTEDFAESSIENIATATNEIIGTIEDNEIVFVEEIPLAAPIPPTGGSPIMLFYELGALLMVSGLTINNRKNNKKIIK